MPKTFIAGTTWIFPILFLTGYLGTASAQNLTGEIAGSVKDSMSAAIPGATITITDTEKHVVVRTTTSGSSGEFTAPSLLIGTYSLTVLSKGFQKAQINDVELHVNDNLSIPIVLVPGSVSQTVNVSEASETPDLISASPSSLISGTQLRELALDTRNFEEVLELQPGVAGSNDTTRGSISATGAQNPDTYSMNGSQSDTQGYFLDGADILNTGSNQQVGIFPSIDAISEMSVVRNAYEAQYGGSGSTVVSLQTKSGTSQFHGDAFYFMQNQRLDANSYFNNLVGTPKAPERYNDFGYTFGGPAWLPHFSTKEHPKVFFFLSQEFLRSAASETQTHTDVPTQAQRQGIFSVPVCIAYNASGSCTNTSTKIANIDPTAEAYLTDVFSKVSLPNNPTDPQGLVSSLTGILNETQTLVRGDYQINDKWSVFFRYMNDPYRINSPVNLFQTVAIPGVTNSITTDGGTNYLAHFTYAHSSSTVLEGGFAYNYEYQAASPTGAQASVNSPNIKPTLPYPSTVARIPNLTIDGLAINGRGPNSVLNRTTYQGFFNFTHVIQKNTLSFGVNVEKYLALIDLATTNAGAFKFSASTSPAGNTASDLYYQAFADFLTGYVSSFTQTSVDATGHGKNYAYQAYVQDNYRPTLRLSLTAGVRYSLMGVISDTNGHLSNFNPPSYNSQLAPAIDTNGDICTAAPCAGGGTPNSAYNPLNGIIGKPTGVAPYGDAATSQPTLSIAPRVGFSYDLFGNGKSALRGGYGIYDSQISYYPYQQMIANNAPYVRNTSITNTSFDDPGGGVPNLSSLPLTLYSESKWTTPYNQNWSLDVQQQMRGDTLLDIGYYGGAGRHLLLDQLWMDVNQPVAGAYAQQGILPGNGVTAANSTKLNQIRPYRGYGPINATLPVFMSNYNSLQVSLTKHFGPHSLININYTYSKSLSNANAPQETSNLGAEYGPALGSTHIFRPDFVYLIPFFEQQHGVIGHALGGWEVSGIVLIDSGGYSTVTTANLDPAGLGLLAGGYVGGAGRPDRISNPNSNAPHTRTQWFNTAAFVPVPAGQYRPGDESIGSIHAPGSQIWNLSLNRSFKFTENISMQLRGETYNTFNHVNWSGLGTGLESTNYGQVTGAGSPRTMQLGGKLYF